ncbi:MAG: hypothetical protein U0528_05195 [Anaerolineae bacterium]
MQEGIAHYHSLLDDQFAADSFEAMSRDLRVRKLYFGERPLCTVLRPHFYTPDQWAHLKTETELVLQAFAKAHIACLNDANLRAQLFLEPYEEQLFSIDIGFEFPWTTLSRLDSFTRWMIWDCASWSTTRKRQRAWHTRINWRNASSSGADEAFPREVSGMKLSDACFAARYITGSSHWQFSGNRNASDRHCGLGDVPTLTEHQLCQQYFEERAQRRSSLIRVRWNITTTRYGRATSASI